MGLGYYSSGWFVGVLPALAGIAIGAGVTLAARDDDALPRPQLRLAAIIATVVFVAASVYFVFEVFDWVDAAEGELSFFGKTFHADPGYHALLAGPWKREGDLKILFDSLFEQVAFGAFPWVALAPIALARLAGGGGDGTRALGARMITGWAVLAWVAASISLRKVGPVQYAALPAIAVGVSVWIDELVSARRTKEADARDDSLVAPLVALFALFAVAVLSMDIKRFPEHFVSVHLDRSISKFPAGVHMQEVVMVLGGLFGLCLVAGLYLWRRPSDDEGRRQRLARRAGQWGLPAALGISTLIAIYLAQVWTPRLSTKLSSKATFSVYHTLREPSDELGILGHATSGAKYYSRGAFTSLRSRNDLIAFLRKPRRVFALVKASELCPIHKEAAKQGFDYYVVDDSNAERVMLSNRMWES
jgi:hypothetical protein